MDAKRIIYILSLISLAAFFSWVIYAAVKKNWLLAVLCLAGLMAAIARVVVGL